MRNIWGQLTNNNRKKIWIFWIFSSFSDSDCQSQSTTINDLPNIVETESSGDANVYTSQHPEEHQQTCDISDSKLSVPSAVYSVDNTPLVDGLNRNTGNTTSTSNIDEIINAVASNQLGNVSKKPVRQVLWRAVNYN